MSRTCFAPYNLEELPTYQKKNLPTGTWVRLHNLHPEATEEEIASVIQARTGVAISLDAIEIRPFSSEASGALVVLSKKDIMDILRWALGEDTICGRPVYVAPPLANAKT